MLAEAKERVADRINLPKNHPISRYNRGGQAKRVELLSWLSAVLPQKADADM